MTTAALITKLKKQLDKETDREVLHSIEFLLSEGTKAERAKRRLMLVAMKSERAIADGRTMTLEEAKLKLADSMEVRRTMRGK
ncbi:MAG: hypothetical protein IT230_07525 [Flavobacteriales bacterium]|nr:hypothetical protein [Flavobacteriales bacterium]